MPVFTRLKQYLFPVRRPESEPAAAYDIWSQQYDNQPNNLMLALDEDLTSGLLDRVDVRGRVVADVGCGTGRHWKKLFDRGPARLSGYDVSGGMLDILRQKYKGAETYQLENERLAGLAENSCDLVLSTLTVAHIPDLEAALREWRRVLKPGGDILITDYHPQALARGGQRTFREGDRVIAVRNYIYPLKKVRAIAGRLGLQVVELQERRVDDTMKPYYEKQQALAVFERFRGVPIIYGVHLKKGDAVQ